MFKSKLFKALADETRQEILQLLREKDLSASEIASHFQISKPSISHHLNILREADLVYSERQGQHIIYSINLSVFQELMVWVSNFQKGDSQS